MLCSKCNTQNPEGAKFCFSCGTKLTSSKKKLVVITALLAMMVGFVLLYRFHRSGLEPSNIARTLTKETELISDFDPDKPLILEAGKDFVPGELLISFVEPLSVTGLIKVNELPKDSLGKEAWELFQVYEISELESLDSSPIEDNPLANIYKIYLPKGIDVSRAAFEFRRSKDILFAEPNYLVEFNSSPNDPFYSSSGSWGQDYDDLWNLKLIDMESTWGITQGDPSVKVAVIDTGVDISHPDLTGNISGEFSLIGGPGDCEGHGTHVAGIIGAVGNNKKGVIGVAPNVSILAVGPGVSGSCPPPKDRQEGRNIMAEAGVASMIAWAANNGASVANLSMSCPSHSALIDLAVNYATLRGMTVVTSAGNNGRPIGANSPDDNPRAVVVGSVDRGDTRTGYSNYGDFLTVVAPGGDKNSDILSLKSGQMVNPPMEPYIVQENYLRDWGTSMAAPHAAGLVALVKSIHPDWTPKQIKCALALGADDKGKEGWDQYYGYGRINPAKTLSVTNPECLEAEITYPSDNSGVNKNEPLVVTGTVFAPDLDNYKLELAKVTFTHFWTTLTTETKVVENNILGAFDLQNLPSGDYLLKLVAKTKNGETAADIVSFSLYDSDTDRDDDTDEREEYEDKKLKFRMRFGVPGFAFPEICIPNPFGGGKTCVAGQKFPGKIIIIEFEL